MSISRILLASLLLFLFHAFAVQAADAPAPTNFQVQAFTIKPGTAPVFEQIVKQYKAAAEKLGNQPHWYAYSPGIGNDLTYSFATPITSFGQLAKMTDVIAAAFGAEEAQKLNTMAEASISNVQSYIVTLRPDLSIAPPQMKSVPEMAVGFSFIIKNGGAPAWEAMLKKLMEASRKTAPHAYWQTYQVLIGAPNMYVIRIPMNWVDLDTPIKPVPQRLVEAFGKKEGTRLMKEIYRLEESQQSNIDRFRADLSYLPAAQ